MLHLLLLLLLPLLAEAQVQIIGAGWGRTGTASLGKALEILGVHPCEHMFRIIKNPLSIYEWTQIAQIEDDSERQSRLRAYLAKHGFQCTLDFPAALFFEDLMALYPEAKVILSVRDSPEEWWASASNTIIKMGDFSGPPRWEDDLGLWCFFNLNPAGIFLMNMWRRTYLTLFPMGSRDKADGMEKYRSWNMHVSKAVPKDKLFVFNTKEGWDPLCKFLDKPVPPVPYPRSNDSADFLAIFAVVGVLGWATLGLSLGLCYCIGRWVWTTW